MVRRSEFKKVRRNAGDRKSRKCASRRPLVPKRALNVVEKEPTLPICLSR